ncbi:hypothetical protein PC122_g18336 [Phytophthora cactorum]|nr:hypothetical protein PC122_g18336 [Phytophthora cactorum]
MNLPYGAYRSQAFVGGFLAVIFQSFSFAVVKIPLSSSASLSAPRNLFCVVAIAFDDWKPMGCRNEGSHSNKEDVVQAHG